MLVALGVLAIRHKSWMHKIIGPSKINYTEKSSLQIHRWLLKKQRGCGKREQTASIAAAVLGNGTSEPCCLGIDKASLAGGTGFELVGTALMPGAFPVSITNLASRKGISFKGKEIYKN